MFVNFNAKLGIDCVLYGNFGAMNDEIYYPLILLPYPCADNEAWSAVVVDPWIFASEPVKIGLLFVTWPFDNLDAVKIVADCV